MSIVEVNGPSPYRVHVGRGILLDEVTRACDGASRVMLVHARPLAPRAASLVTALRDAGSEVHLFELPDGEQAKTVDVLAEGWRRLAEGGFTRSDVVLALGGGSTTDLAGFLAASWLRGVGFVNAPTTVLAAVDAAVGGKTGINLSAGKNLVGAFHEPLAVVCDLDLLESLPRTELASGMAEVVKCGFISDGEIVRLVERQREDALDVTSEVFAELVTRGIQVKATVVATDLREATSTGDRVGREMLNYGHTLGHAIEKTQHYTWRHGEAISVGMVFAAELSHRALGLDAAEVERQRQLLAGLGLPVRHSGDWSQLRAAMSLDKKSRGNRLRFVGLREPGRVSIIDDPDEATLQDCWAVVGDRPEVGAN